MFEQLFWELYRSPVFSLVSPGNSSLNFAKFISLFLNMERRKQGRGNKDLNRPVGCRDPDF